MIFSFGLWYLEVVFIRRLPWKWASRALAPYIPMQFLSYGYKYTIIIIIRLRKLGKKTKGIIYVTAIQEQIPIPRVEREKV